MTPKVFDGLHGNIILVCSVCSKRHVPRCKMPEAVSLGALGGKSRSKAKIEASKANGKLGGRPKKVKEPSSPIEAWIMGRGAGEY